MIIDAHAHLVAPASLYAYRANLLADGGFHLSQPVIKDEEVAPSAQSNIDTMDAVGTDVQLLSPRPYHQGHSMQPSRLVHAWIQANNDVIAQTVRLHPTRFAGVAGLPITPGAPVTDSFDELHRTVDDLGFVGVTVNPDPTEGLGTHPAMGDPYWFPLYEKLVELDVPVHVHSAGCYSERETYSEHFITEESIAILSMLRGDVFDTFPDLRVMISHGGGSVPYQLGRWQAEELHPGLGGGPDARRFEDKLKQFYFDSVLHYPLALELLLKTVGADKVLFGTERPGSGSATNPESGAPFDDLKPVIEKMDFLSDADREAVFSGNVLKVFPRLAGRPLGASA
jgi:4-oxalmesaconate hydratase